MSGTRSLHKACEACRPLKARRPFPLSTGAINRNQTTQFDLGSGRPSRQISTSGGCRYAKPTELPSTQQLRPKSRASPLRPEVPISSIPNTSRTLSTSSSVPADNAPSPSVTSSSSSNAVAAAAPKSSTTDKDQGQPLRLPRSVQAAYLKPLRIPPTHGLPVCSLQLRSFSVRNLEFMADFAMRAAYYLGLPAKGPVPLPRKIERWTLSKSNFVHTKTKENFERITLKRAIEIQDGEAEVVKIWLAYLRRHAFWGVGMKANIWEFESLGKLLPPNCFSSSNSFPILYSPSPACLLHNLD